MAEWILSSNRAGLSAVALGLGRVFDSTRCCDQFYYDLDPRIAINIPHSTSQNVLNTN